MKGHETQSEVVVSGTAAVTQSMDTCRSLPVAKPALFWGTEGGLEARLQALLGAASLRTGALVGEDDRAHVGVPLHPRLRQVHLLRPSTRTPSS